MENKLISDILFSTKDSKLLWKEIKANIEKYRNVSLDEIDPDHEWVSTQDFLINEVKFFGKHILILKAYKCIKTQSLGYTYIHQDKYILKPFKVINHNWKYLPGYSQDKKSYITKLGLFYKCKNCEIIGIKSKYSNDNIVIPYNDQCLVNNQYLFTCDEKIISDIII